jgi:hypothetical protein
MVIGTVARRVGENLEDLREGRVMGQEGELSVASCELPVKEADRYVTAGDL